jgi:hypothetical protein
VNIFNGQIVDPDLNDGTGKQHSNMIISLVSFMMTSPSMILMTRKSVEGLVLVLLRLVPNYPHIVLIDYYFLLVVYHH